MNVFTIIGENPNGSFAGVVLAWFDLDYETIDTSIASGGIANCITFDQYSALRYDIGSAVSLLFFR
jgi:hypothetical protein